MKYESPENLCNLGFSSVRCAPERREFGMEKKEQKRRKFHETLLNIFYPDTQPSPYQQDVEEEEPAVIVQEECSNMDHITDFFDDAEEKSLSETGDCAPQKLTRAQRKKLRRKMLQKTASCRRKIIGPLLPASMDGNGVLRDDDEPPSFHEMPMLEASSTDVQGLDGEIDKAGGEMSGCSTQNKLKHRRLAKRLSRNMVDACDDQVHPSCSKDESAP